MSIWDGTRVVGPALTTDSAVRVVVSHEANPPETLNVAVGESERGFRTVLRHPADVDPDPNRISFQIAPHIRSFDFLVSDDPERMLASDCTASVTAPDGGVVRFAFRVIHGPTVVAVEEAVMLLGPGIFALPEETTLDALVDKLVVDLYSLKLTSELKDVELRRPSTAQQLLAVKVTRSFYTTQPVLPRAIAGLLGVHVAAMVLPQTVSDEEREDQPPGAELKGIRFVDEAFATQDEVREFLSAPKQAPNTLLDPVLIFTGDTLTITEAVDGLLDEPVPFFTAVSASPATPGAIEAARSTTTAAPGTDVASAPGGNDGATPAPVSPSASSAGCARPPRSKFAGRESVDYTGAPAKHLMAAHKNLDSVKPFVRDSVAFFLAPKLEPPRLQPNIVFGVEAASVSPEFSIFLEEVVAAIAFDEGFRAKSSDKLQEALAQKVPIIPNWTIGPMQISLRTALDVGHGEGRFGGVDLIALRLDLLDPRTSSQLVPRILQAKFEANDLPVRTFAQAMTKYHGSKDTAPEGDNRTRQLLGNGITVNDCLGDSEGDTLPALVRRSLGPSLSRSIPGLVKLRLDRTITLVGRKFVPFGDQPPLTISFSGLELNGQPQRVGATLSTVLSGTRVGSAVIADFSNVPGVPMNARYDLLRFEVPAGIVGNVQATVTIDAVTSNAVRFAVIE